MIVAILVVALFGLLFNVAVFALLVYAMRQLNAQLAGFSGKFDGAVKLLMGLISKPPVP